MLQTRLQEGDTLAIANDNDYDIGTFVNGQNQGTGLKSQILIIDGVPVRAKDD